MKNPGTSCAPIFALIVLNTFVVLSSRVDWTRPEAGPIVIMIIVTGSVYLAVAVGMGYGKWKETHDPAREESADIMNAWGDYRYIPEIIWEKAVGTRVLSQNNNQHYWRPGWNLQKVLHEYEITKSLERSEWKHIK